VRLEEWGLRPAYLLQSVRGAHPQHLIRTVEDGADELIETFGCGQHLPDHLVDVP
jgi:predicted RecB family endonuclease